MSRATMAPLSLTKDKRCVHFPLQNWSTRAPLEPAYLLTLHGKHFSCHETHPPASAWDFPQANERFHRRDAYKNCHTTTNRPEVTARSGRRTDNRSLDYQLLA